MGFGVCPTTTDYAHPILFHPLFVLPFPITLSTATAPPIQLHPLHWAYVLWKVSIYLGVNPREKQPYILQPSERSTWDYAVNGAAGDGKIYSNEILLFFSYAVYLYKATMYNSGSRRYEQLLG